MRSWTRRQLLWQGVSILIYLAGLALFFIVVVGVFLAPPANSLENLSGSDVTAILVSVLLIIAGRLISWKLGIEGGLRQGALGYSIGGVRPRAPDQSPLEELGYRMPVEEEETESDVVYEDGELYLVCSECGERNENDFRYCGNCSARLPE